MKRIYSLIIFGLLTVGLSAQDGRLWTLQDCITHALENNISLKQQEIQVKQPQQFMDDEREGIETAYPGDIIGLFDPGIFSIGDTLCTGKKKVEFAGIPTFSPEHFARIEQKDTMKRKQFVKLSLIHI